MYVRDPSSEVALIAERSELDYFDQQQAALPEGMTAFQAYCCMTADSPAWLRGAFWVRDKLSQLAGVEQIDGFSAQRPVSPPQEGGKLDFFDVLAISDDELLLTSVDRHLGVLIAINIERTEHSGSRLTITASVRNKNFFGRLYMIPVAPAHVMIVRNMLGKLPL